MILTISDLLYNYTLQMLCITFTVVRGGRSFASLARVLYTARLNMSSPFNSAAESVQTP